MDNFDWIRTTEKKEEEMEEKKRKEISNKKKEEKSPLPPEKIAVLALIDIAPEVKELREIPQFFNIKRHVTTIGTGRGMHIKLLDIKTIKTKHGIIVFKDGQFYIYPEEGKIKVNGKIIISDGEILKNGSQIETGSARFVFLTNIECNS